MTKVVVSRKGPFAVTLHLMKEYWVASTDVTNNQRCFITQHRPDLMTVAEFHYIVDNILSLTWNNKNSDMLYDITTQELMIFSDTLESRTDPAFVKVVEASLATNHNLEVLTISNELAEREWGIVYSPDQQRELVELMVHAN